MKFARLPNGNLVIPVNFELGGVEGHAYVEITPEDPRYAEWTPFIGSRWELVLETNDWRGLSPSEVIAARRA